jgi:hypothetical protein
VARVYRQLRITVATAQGALPVLVAAAVTPVAEGCYESDGRDHEAAGAGGAGTQGGGFSGFGAAGSGGASGTSGVSGVAGTSGAGGTSGIGGAGGEGGAIGVGGIGGIGGVAGASSNECVYEPNPCRFTVELPPEGVPAEPGQICAARIVPVESNRAASISLQPTGPAFRDVTGLVLVAPELLGMTVGTPELELIDATDASLLPFTVDSLEADPSGFRFTGHFGDGPTLCVDSLTRVTMRVSLQVMCPEAPQLVHAVTDAHLCGANIGSAEWVSSGSVCSVCRVIAEMAPSPIVPDHDPDGLPLAGVLRLRIVELARISGSVVLLAEHDGGGGLSYEWRATDGELRQLAPDVIALSLPITASAPLVQVAAFGQDSAAVASWAFNAEVA